MGLGTANNGAKDFIRSSVVVPANAFITGLVLSIRDETLASGESITGEIYRSTDCGVTSSPTGVKVTINGPNPPNCCGSVTANYQVNRCDLLSVKFDNEEAIEAGATAAILLRV